MSEQNIWNGTFVLGDVSATTLSAGNGIKITTDEPGVIKVSNDETVLWSATSTATKATACNLSESLLNFEHFEVDFQFNDGYIVTKKWNSDSTIGNLQIMENSLTVDYKNYVKLAVFSSNGDNFVRVRTNDLYNFSSNNSGANIVWPYEIRGINRKQNGGN